MSIDARVAAGIAAMIETPVVPPAPLDRIRARIGQQPAIVPPVNMRRRYAIAAAIAAAMLIGTPLASPAIMQNIEARYRAALQALGGIAPPAAPASVTSQLAHGAKTVTLAQAQGLVPFKIVPPSGVPNDAVLSGIVASPTEVYLKATRSWHQSAPLLSFWYRRANGQQFAIVADAYDPREEMGQYLFEARGEDRNGHVVLIKHRRFAWRNGDQVMTAIEGPEISGSEILAIQRAMHGTSVPLRALHSPDHSSTERLRMIIKP